MVVAMVACEVEWLRKLLKNIGKSIHVVVVLYDHDISIIMLANNLVYHARIKLNINLLERRF